MSPAPDRSRQQDLPPLAGFADRNHCLSRLADLARTSTRHPLVILWIAPHLASRADRQRPALPEAALERLARRLPAETSEDALWCRMSASEFVCLLSDHDFDHAQRLADRLLSALQLPLLLDDQPLQPAASIGVAFLDAGESPYACLGRADQAMQAARRCGENRLIVSGAEPLPGRMGVHLAGHELELENRLYRAIEQGGLSLHYQPCVDAAGRAVSVEALLRCDAPHLATADAIPIAEKTGLIVRLGEWALLEAARAARRLASGGTPLPVSVNVSRGQLGSPRFPRTLHAALLCAGLAPALLELELAEALLQDHGRTVQSNLRALQQDGVQLVMDDFGSTHSCLASLKNTAPARIKLDRKFVAALPYDRRAFSVLTALARLAAEFGIEIVAKGVETTEQLDALHQAGIYRTQGFLHAPPMAEDALRAWLTTGGRT